MLIEDIPLTWQGPVTLARDEGWMCRAGQVLVDDQASGPENRGVWLQAGGAWPFPEGTVLYYRSLIEPGASIARGPIV